MWVKTHCKTKYKTQVIYGIIERKDTCIIHTIFKPNMYSTVVKFIDRHFEALNVKRQTKVFDPIYGII